MKAYSSFSEQGRWNEWGAGSVIPKTTENVCLVMYQIETPDLQQSSRYLYYVGSVAHVPSLRSTRDLKSFYHV
ncbi:hypothetical protein HanXRQr2_Chr05g0220471 [Helianthus annuus]|uniref:Uncharacterized protein n=1 Tax=Helianthus annuus TaxID=4232 RepID=A0A9K3J0R3_HELAN|nr:hypothetical protein HanXRQr2_Chr05g0220471 [Helianthus annuus]